MRGRDVGGERPSLPRPAAPGDGARRQLARSAGFRSVARGRGHRRLELAVLRRHSGGALRARKGGLIRPTLQARGGSSAMQTEMADERPRRVAVRHAHTKTCLWSADGADVEARRGRAPRGRAAPDRSSTCARPRTTRRTAPGWLQMHGDPSERRTFGARRRPHRLRLAGSAPPSRPTDRRRALARRPEARLTTSQAQTDSAAPRPQYRLPGATGRAARQAPIPRGSRRGAVRRGGRQRSSYIRAPRGRSAGTARWDALEGGRLAARSSTGWSINATAWPTDHEAMTLRRGRRPALRGWRPP